MNIQCLVYFIFLMFNLKLLLSTVYSFIEQFCQILENKFYVHRKLLLVFLHNISDSIMSFIINQRNFEKGFFCVKFSRCMKCLRCKMLSIVPVLYFGITNYVESNFGTRRCKENHAFCCRWHWFYPPFQLIQPQCLALFPLTYSFVSLFGRQKHCRHKLAKWE